MFDFSQYTLPSRPVYRPKKTYQSRTGSFKWKTADGEVVSMKDMSTEHLKNAISLAQSQGNTGKEKDLRQTLYERLGKEIYPF